MSLAVQAVEWGASILSQLHSAKYDLVANVCHDSSGAQVSTVCGDISKKIELQNIIKTILPDKEIRNYFLTLLSTALIVDSGLMPNLSPSTTTKHHHTRTYSVPLQ